MILARILIKIRFMYSAKKNIANAIPEYSTWKPATICDSPTETSKGALFVSAIPEIKYILNNTSEKEIREFILAKDKPKTLKIISSHFVRATLSR